MAGHGEGRIGEGIACRVDTGKALIEAGLQRLAHARPAVRELQDYLKGLRGQNLLGYRHYEDTVVDRFVERSAENGIDVFRLHDPLNDVSNLREAGESVASALTGGYHLAFAIGALAHYASDNVGHPDGVNRSVPLLYPTAAGDAFVGAFAVAPAGSFSCTSMNRYLRHSALASA